jgi:HTH-type transcriptional regulator / antitoxin HigA
VQIINRVRLRDFWIEHTRGEDALRAWFQLLSSFDWESPEALAGTFPAAQTHSDLTAFEIRGGSFFVITSIDYQRGAVWIRDMLVHSDFRQEGWKSLAAGENSDHRTYGELVDAFPLRPITDDDRLRQAVARSDSLLSQAERSRDEQDYLDVLSLLVRDYEARAIPVPPVSGAEVVRSLINEHRLSQAEIIPLLGGKQKSMALLQGLRPLDLRQATRASRYFRLPAETFMDPEDLEIEIPKAPRRRA